jgi:hypothetical protein
MKRTRLVLVGLGVAGMAYAVLGAITDPDVRVTGVLIFLAVVLIAHDAIWTPLVLAVGTLVKRIVPARYRGIVRGAALVAVAITLVALPLVLGFGRAADNPSILPRSYGRNLVAILVGIIVVAAVVAARARWSARRLTERSENRSEIPDDQ